MTNLITSNDFTGRFEIAQKTVMDTGKITTYISSYQDSYLNKLFGVELFGVWSVDPDAVPYDELTDPFIVKIGCKQYESKGVHEMLKGFIYFQYQKDNSLQETGSGNRELQTANTRAAGYGYIRDRYNEAIDTYKAIQAYCMNNSDKFPQFDGIELGYMIF